MSKDLEREKFGSRLGFILISAGCAIGLGNVWGGGYFLVCAVLGGLWNTYYDDGICSR